MLFDSISNRVPDAIRWRSSEKRKIWRVCVRLSDLVEAIDVSLEADAQVSGVVLVRSVLSKNLGRERKAEEGEVPDRRSGREYMNLSPPSKHLPGLSTQVNCSTFDQVNRTHLRDLGEVNGCYARGRAREIHVTCYLVGVSLGISTFRAVLQPFDVFAPDDSDSDVPL